MTQVRVATAADLADLGPRERLPADELAAVVARGRVLLAADQDTVVGWLRWGLFWDEVPFMNLLYVDPPHRRAGVGRLLVDAWESRCRRAGHAMVLTSTLADESAQHFYRTLGYRDAGCLLLPGEALEILFTKPLTPAG